jgi:hypothetical protein
MSSRNIAAIHDRIDEEHFELRLHASAIEALQRRVILLETAVSELRLDAFGALNEVDRRHRKTHPAGGRAFPCQSK